MKKKLDIATVANELRGGSAFFPEYNKSASAEHSSQLPSNDQEALKPATEAS